MMDQQGNAQTFSSALIKRLSGWLALLVITGGFAGCSTVEDFTDGGLFSKKETPLPGQRQALFEDVASAEPEDTSPVVISGAVSYSSWGQVGGSVTNHPPHVAFSGQGVRVWSNRAAIKGGKSDLRAEARPVSVGGRVAVYSPDGKVSVHSVGNGGRIWSTSVRPENEKGAVLGGAVAMDAARVYAATGFSQLVALEGGSGRRLWSFDLDAPARGAPAVVGDKVIAVTATNSVYAVNISDGSELWVFNGIPAGTSVLGAASPAIAGNLVIFAGSSGEIVALNVKTGEMEWSETIVQRSRRFAVSGISAVTGSPVVVDNVVYVASVGGSVAAFKLRTGERLWERTLGSVFTPVVSGNSLFLLDLDDRMVALNRKTGKIRWAKQLPSIRERKKRSAWSGPVLAGGGLWATSSEGQLASVSPTDGNVKVIRKIKDPVYIAPIAASGRLITLSGSGILSAFK